MKLKKLELKKEVIASLSNDAMANVVGGNLSQDVCQYSIEPCKPVTGIVCITKTEKNTCAIPWTDQETNCAVLTNDCVSPSVNCAYKTMTCPESYNCASKTITCP